jgi:hypothetical protein
LTIETIRIETTIKVHFAPTLRAQGFTGSGRTFRRTRNGQIHLVNIQGSSYGGQFAINLAIQPIAIPDVLGNEPDSKKIIERECEFRRRLSESGADQWWRYDDSASLEKAMDDAVKVYEEYGRPAFEAMSMSPSPLDTIKLEQLVEGRVALNGFETSKVRLALIIARLREAEGRISDAVSFAAYGLEHSTRAFGLRSELERIAALPLNPLIQTR